MQNHKIKKIDVREKNLLVSSQQFGIYHDIWHYSFSDIFSDKFFHISDKDGRVNIIREPLDEWSPVLMYMNYKGPPLIRTDNLISEDYNTSQAGDKKVFWYLSLTTFEDFLKRRDATSAHPNTNFPSSKTYQNVSRKMAGILHHDDLNRDFFVENYNKLQNAAHQSGDTVLNCLTRSELLIPKEWIKTAYVTHKNEIVAIALLVDDMKSMSLVNMAARRSNLSFGLRLIVEIIQYCCEHNYYSVDGGVSGKYGVYKDKLFLDSKAIMQGNDFFYKHNQSYFKSFITNRVFRRIKRFSHSFLVGQSL